MKWAPWAVACLGEGSGDLGFPAPSPGRKGARRQGRPLAHISSGTYVFIHFLCIHSFIHSNILIEHPLSVVQPSRSWVFSLDWERGKRVDNRQAVREGTVNTLEQVREGWRGGLCSLRSGLPLGGRSPRAASWVQVCVGRVPGRCRLGGPVGTCWDDGGGGDGGADDAKDSVRLKMLMVAVVRDAEDDGMEMVTVERTVMLRMLRTWRQWC